MLASAKPTFRGSGRFLEIRLVILAGESSKASGGGGMKLVVATIVDQLNCLLAAEDNGRRFLFLFKRFVVLLSSMRLSANFRF